MPEYFMQERLSCPRLLDASETISRTQSGTQDSDAYSKEHYIRLECAFQAALHKTRMRIPRSTTRVEDATDPEKPPSVIISPRF